MNVLALSPSNGVAYLQAGAGLERMSQFRQSVDVLRTAVRLLPRHARAYDRLGLVLYKAVMHVEWSVFREQPGLQQPPDRLPGGAHSLSQGLANSFCVPLDAEASLETAWNGVL